MWRNWLPVNQVPSDASDYESPPEEEPEPNELVSPRRPHQSASASPRALLVPDPPPVEEVLNNVEQRLRNLPTRSERVQNRNAVRQAQEAAAAEAEREVNNRNLPVGDEVVVAGFESQAADHQLGDEPVIMAARYDNTSGNDEPDVYTKLSTLKSEFNKSDPKFWFNNFERTIKHYGVKSQTTKYEALINQLTREATEEVKNILRQDEAELGATPYLTLKTELLSLYSPKPEDCYAKASSRVLVGLPSSLGKQIINDFCDCAKPIENKCCAKMAYGMWIEKLPTYVKAFISKETFNKDTYKAVFTLADKVFLSHKTDNPVVAAIKAEQNEVL